MLEILTLAKLRTAIELAPWFKNLGQYMNCEFGMGVSPDAWIEFVSAGTRSDFGLAPVAPASAPMEFKEWLPTTFSASNEPFPADATRLAPQTEIPEEVKKARLKVSMLTLRSLRGMYRHSLLKSGPDVTEAARGAARFACWSAATELSLGAPGFWSRLIPIYTDGNWPFGLTRDGKVLVL